jgi:hypothetical protein
VDGNRFSATLSFVSRVSLYNELLAIAYKVSELPLSLIKPIPEGRISRVTPYGSEAWAIRLTLSGRQVIVGVCSNRDQAIVFSDMALFWFEPWMACLPKYVWSRSWAEQCVTTHADNSPSFSAARDLLRKLENEMVRCGLIQPRAEVLRQREQHNQLLIQQREEKFLAKRAVEAANKKQYSEHNAELNKARLESMKIANNLFRSKQITDEVRRARIRAANEEYRNKKI